MESMDTESIPMMTMRKARVNNSVHFNRNILTYEKES